jgi:hypothetical protein
LAAISAAEFSNYFLSISPTFFYNLDVLIPAGVKKCLDRSSIAAGGQPDVAAHAGLIQLTIDYFFLFSLLSRPALGIKPLRN